MTDEQIKQNAETAYPGFEDLQTMYIEGAHSLDEEIKELKQKLHEEKDFGDFKDTQINSLKDQLRNPWISVEERLPEDDVDVIGMTKRGWVFLIRRNSSEWCGTEYRELQSPEITHWMPIPELPKWR